MDEEICINAVSIDEISEVFSGQGCSGKGFVVVEEGDGGQGEGEEDEDGGVDDSFCFLFAASAWEVDRRTSLVSAMMLLRWGGLGNGTARVGNRVCLRVCLDALEPTTPRGKADPAD